MRFHSILFLFYKYINYKNCLTIYFVTKSQELVIKNYILTFIFLGDLTRGLCELYPINGDCRNITTD